MSFAAHVVELLLSLALFVNVMCFGSVSHAVFVEAAHLEYDSAAVVEWSPTDVGALWHVAKNTGNVTGKNMLRCLRRSPLRGAQLFLSSRFPSLHTFMRLQLFPNRGPKDVNP